MAAADNSTLVGWRNTQPHDRGTYDIISLCVSTLIICAWSAVHIDVPKRRTFKSTHGARIFWCLIGVFTPEILLASAVGQFLGARRISAYAYEELGFELPLPWWKRWYSWIVYIRKGSPTCLENHDGAEAEVALSERGSAPPKGVRKHAWTSSHSFYALMGGFPDVDPGMLSRGREGIKMSNIENAPDVSLDDIMDRSNPNPLSKAVLCAQIVFFWANCAARINQHLPLSLLEITTIAHSLCALGAYAVWWNKPQDVGGEAPLRNEQDTLEYLFHAVLAHYAPGDGTPVPCLLSILAVTAMIAALYGCPHLLGLHTLFPTPAEHVLWLVSIILVICCPILVVLPFCIMEWTRADHRGAISFGLLHCFIVLLLGYEMACAFFVSESVRQVFALPDAAFRQPQWTRYIPHFS